MKNSIKYKIRTVAGVFIFKCVALTNRDTKRIESYTISLGSKDRYCVQIRVPSKESDNTDAYLMWVEAHEDCSLESYINKGLAKHMTLLGLTLARKINANIKTVSFEDTSSFKCELPNGIEKQVPMKAFHIAFHGATWYEYNFDARLKKGYDKYCKLKTNMYKSEHKPATFEFMNDELQEELEPLYKATTNWHEFFQEISKKYKSKKCAMIYPWIIRAMNMIFDCSIYEETQWYIDFKENEEQNKTPLVKISMSDPEMNGGSKMRQTMKKRKNRRYTFSRTHMFPNIPEIQGMRYRDYLGWGCAPTRR